MKILAVENHEPLRQMMKGILEPIPATLIMCATGTAACRTYAEQLPDWVLMDVAASELDGFAATRRIKADFPDARVIILAQYDEPELWQAAKDAGAWAFLLKENLLAVRSFIETHSAPT